MVVWGTNFVVIKLALGQLPPLLFASMRFFFAAMPLVFFLKRPAVRWRNLAAYGLLIGACQFGLLFIAMKADISSGLASLVVQTQAFFTVGLAMLFTGERLRPYQWTALALATSGLGLILAHAGGGPDATPLGLGLTILAAMSWAGGNLVARSDGPVNMLSYIAWASLFSFPPLLALSLIFEGWPAIASGLSHATALTWAAVAYQSVGNTLFGYGIWGFLMARYPTATISPLSMLVPVTGMAASALILAEPLQGWKLSAAALVLAGLAINVFWPRRRARTPVRT